jgi:hypothetical protein
MCACFARDFEPSAVLGAIFGTSNGARLPYHVHGKTRTLLDRPYKLPDLHWKSGVIYIVNEEVYRWKTDQGVCEGHLLIKDNLMAAFPTGHQAQPAHRELGSCILHLMTHSDSSSATSPPPASKHVLVVATAPAA